MGATKEASEFIVLSGKTSTTFKTLHRYVLEIMPTITGVLLISTNRGIMTHHTAYERKLGGKIIGCVY